MIGTLSHNLERHGCFYWHNDWNWRPYEAYITGYGINLDYSLFHGSSPRRRAKFSKFHDIYRAIINYMPNRPLCNVE